MIRLNFKLCSRITLFLPDVRICEEGIIGILYIRSILHFYYIFCNMYNVTVFISVGHVIAIHLRMGG
jgi:hypothetical protein